MKTFKLFSIIMLLGAVFILGSCKDDDDGGSTGGDVYLTCKIDGADFAANALTVGGTVTGSIFRVQGNTSAGKSIVLSLGNYNGLDTYGFGTNFLASAHTAIYTPDVIGSPNDSYAAVHFGNNAGEITVTLDDGTYVEGTFNFGCANQQNTSQTANITEGKFRMKLP